MNVLPEHSDGSTTMEMTPASQHSPFAKMEVIDASAEYPDCDCDCDAGDIDNY